MDRTVERMKIYGQPGGYAGTLARRALTRGAVFQVPGLAAGAAALAALVSAGPDGSPPWPLIAVLAALAAAGTIAARPHWDAASRALVGRRSELRVARSLRRSRAHAVVHGALLGAGGDADHVVLGPAAVVVETKTGSGTVRVGRDGRIETHRSVQSGSGAGQHRRRTIPGDPAGQAARQARQLGRAVGQHAYAVVCIPDMANAPLRNGDVIVCSARDLPKVIDALPATVDEGTALTYAASIHAHHVAETARRDATPTAQGRAPRAA